MGHDIIIIVITAAVSIPVSTGVTWLIAVSIRGVGLDRKLDAIVLKLSKRIGRVEGAVPVAMSVILELLDSFISVLKAVNEHQLNGEVAETKEKIEKARGEMRDFLTEASISKKE